MKQKLLLALVATTAASAALLALSSVAEGDAVTVTASVADSVSCSANIASTAFGTLTAGSIATATTNASTSLSCNTGLGCTLFVQDAGDGSNPGLATTSPAYLIQSQTATLSAGTEGYGIQATTTGSGDEPTINTIYNKTGNDVGGLSLTNVTLTSSAAAGTFKDTLVTHKAAISGSTQAGDYSDTITYSCSGN